MFKAYTCSVGLEIVNCPDTFTLSKTSIMRSFLITAFLLIAFSLAATEPRHVLKSRIDSLHYYAAVYDTMSPFSESQQHYEKLLDYQQRIIAILLEVLNNQQYFRLYPEKMISTPAISHTISPDYKTHIFSLDEKTGGSFRSNISIIHFIQEKYMTGELLPAAYSYHYYSNIYEVDTAVYLAIGEVTSCNTCTSTIAMLISFNEKREPQYETVASVDCRFNDLKEFRYNDTTKVISYKFGTRSDDSMYGEVSGNREEEGHQPWMIHESGELTWRNGKFRLTANCMSTELLEW